MNLAPLYNAPLIMHAHIVLAVLSMALGAIQLSGKKGTTGHKKLGWIWVGLMVGVGITACLLPAREAQVLHLTKLLVIWLIVGLPLSIWAVKNGRILLHRAFMIGLYIGGLAIAAAFTLTPGRLLYKIFIEG